MADPIQDIRRQKQGLRERIRQTRRLLAEKDALSSEICRRVAALPEFSAASTVALYVAVRSEVRTRALFALAWQQGKRVVVPYCHEHLLELFHLRSFDELSEGAYGVLEPTAEWRANGERRVEIADVDLIVVPGIAFDRHGGRSGRGKGYYDRLLRHVGPHSAVVAPAFECQMVDSIPMQPHDVYVDMVVTEKAVYRKADPT